MEPRRAEEGQAAKAQTSVCVKNRSYQLFYHPPPAYPVLDDGRSRFRLARGLGTREWITGSVELAVRRRAPRETDGARGPDPAGLASPRDSARRGRGTAGRPRTVGLCLN